MIMTNPVIPIGYITTDQPDLFFEDNPTGRLKKEIWDASDDQIETILSEYGIPSPVEWAKPGSYIHGCGVMASCLC
jgi:creatinine amidohydrolase